MFSAPNVQISDSEHLLFKKTQKKLCFQSGGRIAMNAQEEILVNDDMILIVDDSKFIAQTYSKVLTDLGYPVLIACDGKTGLFAAASCGPSLILLDIHLPIMNGAEVLLALKRSPSTSRIPVLVISSLSEKNATQIVEEGAAGYFEKRSMTQEKLENAVSGILKKRLLVPQPT